VTVLAVWPPRADPALAGWVVITNARDMDGGFGVHGLLLGILNRLPGAVGPGFRLSGGAMLNVPAAALLPAKRCWLRPLRLPLPGALIISHEESLLCLLPIRLDACRIDVDPLRVDISH
jgi:hypothetical protein